MSKKEFTCKVDGKEWEEMKKKAFNKLNKKAKIDGFRPGKAPLDVYLKHYGNSYILEKASDMAINKKYMDLTEEIKDMPLFASPSVDITKVDEDMVEFVIKLVVEPTVELGDYKNLKTKKEKIKVTKEDIDKRIDELLDSYAELQIVEDQIKEKDIAFIDFEGFLEDGTKFEGGTGENYELTIGSHTFIDNFEEQLIGLKVGDNKEVKVTFPDAYHEESLQGKKVTFKVIINEVKRRVLPELTKEFFDDLDYKKVQSEDALRKEVEKELKEEKDCQAERKYRDDLFDELVSVSKIDLEEEQITDYTEHSFKNYSIQFQDKYNISFEEYIKFAKISEDELKKKFEAEARKVLSFEFVLAELEKIEKISYTDDDYEKCYKQIAKDFRCDVEEIKEVYNKDRIENFVRCEKLFDLLKEYNKKKKG